MFTNYSWVSVNLYKDYFFDFDFSASQRVGATATTDSECRRLSIECIGIYNQLSETGVENNI